MENNILDSFGVKPCPIEDILDESKVNLIGLDFGDGNCCAAKLWFTDGKKPRFRHLFFDPAHNADVLQTLISFNLPGKEYCFLGKEAVQGSGALDQTPAFLDFKRPVGSDVSQQCYGGDFSNDTYEELMRRFFQEMARRLFECNTNLKEAPRTIFFVGRPASEYWSGGAHKYQKLLLDGLQVKGYTDRSENPGSIDLVIYSEAQAALAYESHHDGIQSGEALLVIDCGSSTFDAALFREKKILAEHSRQLGASQIERIMLDLVLSGERIEDIPIPNRQWEETEGDVEGADLSPGLPESLSDPDSREDMRNEKIKLVTTDHEGTLLFRFRGNKEDYFGPNGKNGDRFGPTPFFMLSGKPIFAVRDEAFMERVLKAIPIRVQGIHTDDAVYESFYAATRCFLQETRERCEAAGKLPDRVILSGGASVMPFIGDLVRETFGENSFGKDENGNPIIFSDNIHFAVGEGLAFMGYVEFKMWNTLTALKQTIRKVLDDQRDSVTELIEKAYVDAAWNKLKNDLNRWVSNGRKLDELFSVKFDIPRDVVCQNIENRIKAIQVPVSGRASQRLPLFDAVNFTINQMFSDLFKTGQAAYPFSVNRDNINAVIQRNGDISDVTLSKSDLLGFFGGLFTNPQKELDLKQRQKKKEAILNRESKIKDSMKTCVSSAFRSMALRTERMERMERMAEATINQQSAVGMAAALLMFNSLYAHTMAKQILNLIYEQIAEELEAYIQTLTPYFIENV